MSVSFSPANQFTQDTRRLKVITGLGEDELLLRRLMGVEGVSQLFHFELELISHNGNINPKDIVGENVGIVLESDDDNVRQINGHVRTFYYVGLEGRGMYQYRAEVVPWLWFLDKTSDCRVYQNQTVKDIIESIFGELGFSDYQFTLNETHDPLEYCVQYGETDLNFVQRLLESEGIFYYFEHQPKKHILHLCDSSTAYPKLSAPNLLHSSGNRLDYYVNSWQHRYQYCSGAFAQADFDFEKFNQSLVTESSSKIKLPNNSLFSRFEYPGNYRDNDKGRALTTLRMQQEEMLYDQATGNSNIHYLAVGNSFTFESEENEADNGSEFVITEIHHSASNPSLMGEGEFGEVYANRFMCIPSDVTFRPPSITPRPRMDGIQTAMVVGPSGEEIYTDKYGRIKIQFHWDRYGKKDENSSCWVRVASQQAGKKWGVVGIPRIGNEVVVSFENGDPDKPLVIGSVFNNENMPPINLPGGKTQTGFKSKTFKGGGGQNVFCVDDTKDNEEMKIHASYNCNMSVDHDLSTSVVNDNTHLVENNSSETVNVDHSMSVGGNQSLSVKGDQTETITGDQDLTVESNQTETVVGDQTISAENQTVTIKSDQNIETTNQNLTVKSSQNINAGEQTTEVKGNQSIKAAQQDTSIQGKANTSATEINLTANTKITLTVGGSSITIDPTKIELMVGASSVKVDMMGVTVMGPKVTLN